MIDLKPPNQFKMNKNNSFLAVLLTLLFLLPDVTSFACTRLVYQGKDGLYLTARSMDWKTEIPPNLWVLPRGIARTGKVGPNSIKWTAKYGSVATTSWDIATCDGMNEKGLVANMLWLGESSYPKYDPKNDKNGLVVSLWAQYMLDNFSTVAQAVEQFKKDEIVVVSDLIPGTDMFTTVHLALSDASGDNAVFEYVNEKLTVHHDRSYNVMTNSPTFDKQLALNEYWKEIPGAEFLPGTNKAADRFVRASYYIDALPQVDNTRVAVASVFSVIRNCSVPYGITTKDQPNISSTRWRTVSDHKNLKYYFESTTTPNTFWVDLNKVDFTAKSSVKKLAVDGDQTYAGETSALFKAANPFVFFGLE